MDLAKQVQLFVLFSITLIAGFIAYRCEATSIEDHYRLHENLPLRNDCNLLRPTNDTRYAVEVGLRFAPVLFVLDEANQELKLRGMLALTWRDFRLQWDPKDYSEINETNIPLKKSGEFTLWTPELVLNESIETDFASFQPETFMVRLDYTGVVQWYTFAVTKSLCRLDYHFYPFDRQTCSLTFTTWAYQTSEQLFYHIDDIITNKMYKDYIDDEGLWEIDISHKPEAGNISFGCWSCEDEEQSFVRYTIDLKRRHKRLYFFGLIFPCWVLSILTCATPFLENVTDADPAGYGLNCILALMLFLTLVFTTLPSSSQPLIGVFIAWLIVDAVLFTLWAILKSSKAARKTDDKQTKVGTDQPKKTQKPINQKKKRKPIKEPTYPILIVDSTGTTDSNHNLGWKQICYLLFAFMSVISKVTSTVISFAVLKG